MFPQRFVLIIQTKAFQRLRRIKQLATADYVFPGAIHSRFAHSIGTYYLMKLVIEHYEKLFRRADIPFRKNERDALLAAALLHDLGHGPYSHAFEALNDQKSHETWTIDILSSDDELKQVFKDHFDESTLKMVIMCLSEKEGGNLPVAIRILRRARFIENRQTFRNIASPMKESDPFQSRMEMNRKDLERNFRSYLLIK